MPNPTDSYWLDDPPFPALCDIQDDELPQEADVVIVGSGITGAAVAKSLLELSDSKLRVVVCEARQICSGATGRNGGHIKSSPYSEFAMFSKRLDPEVASKVVRFKRSHLEMMKQVGAKIGHGDVREVETVDLYLGKEEFESAKKQVYEARKWMPEEEHIIWEGEEARNKVSCDLYE